jgi:germination protein M
MEDNMKRFIVVLLAIQVIMLAGCSLPFFGRSGNEPLAIAEEQDMVYVRESNDRDNTAEGASYAEKVGQDGTEDIVPGENSNGSASGTGAIDISGLGSGSEPYSGGTAGAESGDVIGGTAGDGGNKQSGAGTDMAVTGVAGTGVAGAALQASLPEYGLGSPADSIFAEPRKPVTVYYQDIEGCIIPMTRWIKPQLGIARAAVSLAVDSALIREELSYYGIYPVIPAKTEILGIDVRDGIAVIDFNRHFLDYGSPESEKSIIASVVYTMTEFDTIDKVQILVNGYSPGILKYGTSLAGALGRDDIAINADPSVLSAGGGKVDIYLLRQVYTGFTYPVPVSVPNNSRITDLPELLVKQLLYTEADDGLFSEMPDGAYLINCAYDNGTIILNFSSEFVNYGGSAREEGILKQLAYTLRQCKNIRKIRIMVDGREAELPEGTDISGGLPVPAAINDIIDR